MPVYVIGEFGTFKDYGEATAYLDDLKKRYAGDAEYDHLDILTYPDGRPLAHTKLVWAYEGVWDWKTSRCVSIDKAWVWQSEIGLPKIDKLIGEHNRYLRLCFDESGVNEYEQRCKRSLSGYKVAGICGDNPEQVIIVFGGGSNKPQIGPLKSTELASG